MPDRHQGPRAREKRWRGLAPIACVFLALGCASSPTESSSTSRSSTSHGHTSTAGGSRSQGGTSSQGGDSSTGTSGSSATSSSTAPSSSAAGSGTTSAASGSSGSTGGASTVTAGCGTVVTYPDGGGCPNGSLVSELVDFASCVAVGGATVQALDANGTPTAGAVTTAQDGTYALCAPPGSAFTPSFSAPGYPQLFDAELQAGENSYLRYTKDVSSNALAAWSAVLPGALQGTSGSIVAQVYTTPDCPDPSGWSLTLTDTDGGALPDGSYGEIYLDPSSIPDPNLTATSSFGYAILYDIDVSSQSYFSLSAAKADAGICTPIVAGMYYTGRIFVAPYAVSLKVIRMPQ